LLALFHQQGNVEQMQHLADGVKIVGYLPGRLIAVYRRFFLPEE
jgi:hypothetical protein